MVKLKAPASRLTPVRPRLAYLADEQGHGDHIDPWRRWYKLQRWQNLRMRVLKRDRFTCQHEGCGKMVSDTSKLVAHHTTPHKGDPIIFWNEKDIVTVCKACHDGPIQAAEKAAYGNL